MSSSTVITTLFLFFYFFFVVVVVVVVPVSSSTAMSSDVDLLLEKIKPALQGPSSTNPELAMWNASTPLCLWRGLGWSSSSSPGAGVAAVACSEPGVRSNISLVHEPSLQLVSLRLPASALSRSLPPELGAFSSLQSLLLPVNSLSGPVPLELANSPSLSQLDLASNSLTANSPSHVMTLGRR